MTARYDIPETSEQVTRQSAELAALRRMLVASQGTFSLSVAVCNSPSLRDYLIAKLKEESPSITIVEVSKEVRDVFDLVSRNVSGAISTGVFVVGIEKLLPSEQKEYKVLQALNATRELWGSHFSCPVVFWLPEYAATLLSVHARDLWSWLSHSFEFISEQATASAGTLDTYAGDIMSAGRLDADQKRFRIAELEQRIDDAGAPPKMELTQHVMTWLNELGYIYMTIGELDKARENVLKSLEISEKIGDLADAGRAYGNLGVIYQTKGDLDRAEEMFRKGLEIDDKVGRLEGIASKCGNLAVIYMNRGDLDRAEDMLRKGLEIDEKVGRLEGVAGKYANLGLIYKGRGELDKAEEMLCKSLETAEKLGLQELIASAYGNLGVIYRKRGDLDKAEELYRNVLQIDERSGRLASIANGYANLGAVYWQRGEVETTRQYWEKAIELYEKIGMPHMVEKMQGWIEELEKK